ncbi:hypothetical protein SAMN05421853_11323 [Roseivivax halotolerans]|uniref:Lactonase, 7-bladed beta-propeller n=1 Tax=Roseivivax halotolerans TaxID=93684 RepID=A0A1I5ZXX5_9RHOB|nr:hypothetical protein [Roseivivax halotolerans]SFQ61288.1 hypothetical protein SAMN05421853_11323 [Roseivivax halotolerans]
MRSVRWVATGLAAVIAGLAAAVGLWNVIDRAPPIAEPRAEADGLNLSRLLVLVDGDMAATAYADGRLHPIEGAQDLLVILDEPNNPQSERRTVPASNTVMGWPGAMTADPSGRFAYVIEGRTPPQPGTDRMASVHDEMPVGTLLTTVDLDSGAVVSSVPVCRRPNSIDIAPTGGWLLIACGDPDAELAVAPLEGGQPRTVRSFDLDLPDIAARPDIDDGLTYAMIHPTGAAAGYVLSNLGVGLVRFTLGDDGVPIAADAEAPVEEGDWLTVGRWTRAGDHFLVADVKWGPTPLGAVFVGDGQIHSFALSPDDDTRGIVSSATVSKSPEAFEMNRAGDRLIAVNMERTYLPGGALALVPGRTGSSLSLLSVDDATGVVATLGDPVGFRGVLPEDVVFDADGDRLAVVVYQDHDGPRSDGWVEIFAIDGDDIVPTGRRIPMPRGAHDLYTLD